MGANLQEVGYCQKTWRSRDWGINGSGSGFGSGAVEAVADVGPAPPTHLLQHPGLAAETCKL